MEINGFVLPNRKQKDKNKGNPAHKRIGNDRLKARRKTCWARGERRKEIRRITQAQAHARNIERGYSAWDEAKSRRAAKRHP